MNPAFPTNSAQKVANIWNNEYALADEGSYFLGTNPVVNTAIATTTSVVDDALTNSATHASVRPVAYIYNQDSVNSPNAVSIYMRFIKMFVVQVPTSATNWGYSMRLDQGNRYTSGGSTIVPVNPNPNSIKGSKCLFYFGAVVLNGLPSGSARIVANGMVDSAIPVANDQWLFTFGNSSPAMDQLNGGTVAKNMTYNVAPIVIPPGWGLTLEMWGTSNAAAPSWEFEFGWAERIPGL